VRALAVHCQGLAAGTAARVWEPRASLRRDRRPRPCKVCEDAPCRVTGATTAFVRFDGVPDALARADPIWSLLDETPLLSWRCDVNFFDSEETMPFQAVPGRDDGSGGNFPSELRTFFNQCGARHYNGSLKFSDSRHRERVVPIFHDDCLEGKAQTYALLQRLRKAMRVNSQLHSFEVDARSIHQNEHGYLPFKDDAPPSRHEVSAPAIRNAAITVGALPHNQASASATTQGQFMEYTCQDGMHVQCRFVVDYRFGFIYMTFGHYHSDSFALLIRSPAELHFEIMPTLPTLNARFVQ
jgi:hypothetical protein